MVGCRDRGLFFPSTPCQQGTVSGKPLPRHHGGLCYKPLDLRRQRRGVWFRTLSCTTGRSDSLRAGHPEPFRLLSASLPTGSCRGPWDAAAGTAESSSWTPGTPKSPLSWPLSAWKAASSPALSRAPPTAPRQGPQNWERMKSCCLSHRGCGNLS